MEKTTRLPQQFNASFFIFVKVNRRGVLGYDGNMKKVNIYQKYRGRKIPLLVEKGEDGFFVIECPLFSGCFTQGKTIDEAMANIREAIELVLEEKENQARLATLKIV